jgi:hypothetical protein
MVSYSGTRKEKKEEYASRVAAKEEGVARADLHGLEIHWNGSQGSP